jgi:hypothetical protein
MAVSPKNLSKRGLNGNSFDSQTAFLQLLKNKRPIYATINRWVIREKPGGRKKTDRHPNKHQPSGIRSARNSFILRPCTWPSSMVNYDFRRLQSPNQ